MRPLASRETVMVAMRAPALLIALTVVHADCTNITRTLFRLISDAGWSNDAWPQIVTDFPACFGTRASLPLLALLVVITMCYIAYYLTNATTSTN